MTSLSHRGFPRFVNTTLAQNGGRLPHGTVPNQQLECTTLIPAILRIVVQEIPSVNLPGDGQALDRGLVRVTGSLNFKFISG